MKIEIKDKGFKKNVFKALNTKGMKFVYVNYTFFSPGKIESSEGQLTIKVVRILDNTETVISTPIVRDSTVSSLKEIFFSVNNTDVILHFITSDHHIEYYQNTYHTTWCDLETSSFMHISQIVFSNLNFKKSVNLFIPCTNSEVVRYAEENPY